MKRKVLGCVLLATILLAGNVWAVSEGDGSSDTPYQVNSPDGSYSGSKEAGNYYVTVSNLYATSPGLYYDTLDEVGLVSYATVSVPGSDGDTSFTVDNIAVRNNEFVTLSTVLPGTSVINGGALTVSAGDVGSGNCNTVQGNSNTGSKLTITSGYSAEVKGSFVELNGNVTLCGPTDIYGGTSSVTGAGESLTVHSGTVSVTGNFSDIYVESGADVKIGGDTEVETYHEIKGTVSVNSNNTLCIQGDSIKGGGGINFDATHPWRSLASGNYDSVVGNWTLTGAVTIHATTCAINGSYTGATVTTNGNNLTVAGGKVATSGTAGELSVIGGELEITADTLADKVAVSGEGKIKLDAGKTLCDGGLSLQSADGNSILLTIWGTLGLGTYDAALTGPWELPAGADVSVKSTECACTVTGHTAHSGAVVTGTGGVLTAASAGVAIEGNFSDVEVSGGQTLSVQGDTTIVNSLTMGSGAQIAITGGVTLCDQDKSVCPGSAATLSKWAGASSGTLPGPAAYGNVTGSWNTQDGVTIQSTGYDCGVHSHGDGVVITGGQGSMYVTGGDVELTGLVSGKVYVSGGTVTDTYKGNDIVTTGGVVVGTATSAADGTKLDAGTQAKLIKGSFASITGSDLILAGDTVVYSTGTPGDTNAYATMTGSGFYLDVRDGDVRVRGTFGGVTTSDYLHVTLAGDAVLNGGNFGLTGNADYRLTVGGGTGHMEGDFKQIIVNDGTITDCDHDLSTGHFHNLNIRNNGTCLIVNGGTVTLDNGGTIETIGSGAVEAVQVKGGKLTVGKGAGRVEGNIYHIYASSSSVSAGNKGISVSGGECLLLDGEIEVGGANSYGVLVFGSGAKFRMGTETNAYAYSSLNTPSILVTNVNSRCVDVDAGGEAWLHGGELQFTDQNGIGIYVAYANGNSGICHVWTGNQYGTKQAGDQPFLYVHGGNNATAAMWVAYQGKFDIRGRGALFEEPSDYYENQYALYIHAEAIPASDYPLSGGTYNGKVRYVGHDLSDLIRYNHYLRYDGTQENYGYSDGTYGVRPGKMNSETDAYGCVIGMHATDFSADSSVYSYDGGYGEYFGKHGEYYTITDAEWELREQMKALSGSYQIPAGIVRSDADLTNAITLDINVFDTDSAKYTPCWGVGKKLGDVDVTGTGHTLYLAGRTLRYDGYNSNGERLDSIVMSGTAGYGYSNADDWRQILDVNGSGSLAVRDSVLGDKSEGGAIGTGTVRYEWVDDSGATKDKETRALYVTGQLDVISAGIEAAASTNSAGISVSANGLVKVGLTQENTDNQLIHILGGLKTGNNASHGIYMDGGSVQVSGGIVGDISSQDYGGNVGIENAGGTLSITGGIVAGNSGGGRAVWSTDASAETYITGGCLYGEYADDNANGGNNNGDSIYVTDGNVYLDIDAAHSGNSYQTTGYTEETIPFTGSNAFVTANLHHINNITVEGGTLVVGARQDYDANYVQGRTREIGNNSRDNGDLLCLGGKTVFYDGIIIGETSIVGDSKIHSASADFGTEFYVVNGAFGGLAVRDGASLTAGKYYGIYGDGKLTDCVQLHGGSYDSIDVSGLTTGWSGVYAIRGAAVNHIVGFWSNGYDADNDGIGDWIGYNHYVTVDTASRNAAGYWTNRSMNLSDNNRFVGGKGTVTAESGKVINVQKGTEEFLTWLTSNAGGYDGIHGNSYQLHCNIWLGTPSSSGNISQPYFHCAWRSLSGLPIAVGAGVHNVDTNNFGIFGDHAGALVSVGNVSSSALYLTNSNSASSTGKFENLVKNYAQQSGGTALQVTDGTLVIGKADGNHNEITIKAYQNAVLVSGAGSLTLNAGTISAEGSDTLSNGASMSGIGKVSILGGTVTGQAGGLTLSAGSANVENASITGQKGCGISISGGKSSDGANPSLTVKAGSIIQGGTDGISIGLPSGVTISGGTVTGEQGNGVDIRSNSASLTVTGGTITGSQGDGIGVNAGATVSITGGTVTGAENGVGIDGAAAVHVSGNSAILRGDNCGMSQNNSGSSVMVTGLPLFTGNAYGFYKSAGAGTGLGGGLYSSIKTVVAGESLSGIMTASLVRESASAETRTAQKDSLTVSDIVLENNSELKASSYDDDGDSATANVLYSPYFLLQSAEVPSGAVGGGGGGGSSDSDGKVFVNGKEQTVSTSETSTDPNGQTVTVVTIDGDKLLPVLEAQGTGAKVTVEIPGSFNVADSVLTGTTIQELANRKGTLEIQTGLASYALPATEINLDAVSQTFGADVPMSDVVVSIRIAEVTDEQRNAMEKMSAESGYQILVSPIDFSISCTYNGKTFEISRFDNYVQRTIRLPDDVSPDKVTTGAAVRSDGSLYQVPTALKEDENGHYAVLSSLTNSTYTLVWNPVVFTDVTDAWARDAVNDMGSRMIVTGVSKGIYDPARNMTRAEFATIMVRALGLAPGEGSTGFADVDASQWYAGYVKTAYEYGIISGYDTQNFGPGDFITREQAMTMMARAMKLTGLSANQTGGVLSKYSDSADVSPYALAGVEACVSTGLVEGRSSTLLVPKTGITRAEVAVIVQRLLRQSALIN